MYMDGEEQGERSTYEQLCSIRKHAGIFGRKKSATAVCIDRVQQLAHFSHVS
jgi:hypothetical protein